MFNDVMARIRDEALTRAIKIAGGLSALSRKLGNITPQGVSRWHRVPVSPFNHVPGVEAATGIPREELRPDVYGAPRPKRLRQSAHA